jgi:aminoglycoside phosphotransferase (APT) family kinase protein
MEEALDCLRLAPYLEAHLPRFERLESCVKCNGGQSNPTYLLSAGSQRYVLRRKPSGSLLPSAHAVDREFRVLRALAETLVPVPRVLVYCNDLEVIGTEFYVMDFIEGRVFWDPSLPELDRAARAQIYDAMNCALAALHQIDPAGVGLADFGRSGGYFERQIRRWTEQYRAAETTRRPDVDRLIDWLPTHLPTGDGQVSLVHGDFRLDNMIFDDRYRLCALIDWELSTVGHPYADLAYQCAQWRLPGSLRGLQGVDRRALGIPDEAAYVAQYLQRRGLGESIRGWAFYLVLSLFRLAAICEGVYRRGLAGNASSEAALGFGAKVDAIAREAAAILDTAP